MIVKKYHFSTDKWTKYMLLKRNGLLHTHLPNTWVCNGRILKVLLNRGSTFFLKPLHGSGGIGIIKISKVDDSNYELHTENTKMISSGIDEALTLIKQHKNRKKRYIVQEGIELPTIERSPFDFRVMVQRNKRSSLWHITGVLAKVAAEGFCVTNVTQNVLTYDEAITRLGLNDIEKDRILAELHTASLLTVKQLSRYYPQRRAFGLDIGLDDHKRIQIIEVNLRPSITYFKHLTDTSVYKKIRSFL